MLVCRANAQDGIPNTRECADLSTECSPKTAKDQTQAILVHNTIKKAPRERGAEINLVLFFDLVHFFVVSDTAQDSFHDLYEWDYRQSSCNNDHPLLTSHVIDSEDCV